MPVPELKCRFLSERVKSYRTYRDEQSVRITFVKKNFHIRL